MNRSFLDISLLLLLLRVTGRLMNSILENEMKEGILTKRIFDNQKK